MAIRYVDIEPGDGKAKPAKAPPKPAPETAPEAAPDEEAARPAPAAKAKRRKK